MSKAKPLIIKYTPYVLFIMGIFIYITFFIAGGIKTIQDIYHPDGSGFYHFTIFHTLFGKTLTVAGHRETYFKFNLSGIFIVFGLGTGIIASTINAARYKIRNLISAASLLLTSLLLFLIPKTAALGSGWVLGADEVITLGAPLIIAVVITALMGVTYLFLAFLKEIN